MLRGGTGAQGARGGLGAIDGVSPAPYGWEAYRRRDPGGALVLAPSGDDDATLTNATPLYAWGLYAFFDFNGQLGWAGGGNTLTALQGGGLVDGLYAIAQPLPAGRLVRLVYACLGNAPPNGSIQMGVYRALGGNGSTNLYPGDLVYDTGAISFAGLGPKSAGAISGGLSLGAGLYYAAITCEAAAAAGGAAGAAIAECRLYPVMGATVRWGNGEPDYNKSLCVGWRASRAFGGALPSTFPTGARRLLIATQNTTAPLIFYGYDPD